MINDLIYLFDIEIYNYLFFFLYTEIHYKVPWLLSRYFIEEPEIIADCPYRIEPNKKLPIMILIKDADKYNIYLESINILFYKKNKLNFSKDIQIKRKIDSYFWYKTFFVDVSRLYREVLIDVEITYKINNTYKTITNYNLKTVDKIPLKVFISKYSFPKNKYIQFSDLHYHTNLTDDMVEFGAPITSTLKAAESMNLNYVCSTDHSYDLDDKVGKWFEKDPSLFKWKNSRFEIEKYNLKSKSFIIPSEEVTVQNNKGENIHALILNNPDFIPGSGDGAKKFFKTKSEFTAQTINTQLSKDSIYIAAHPFEDVPLSQKILLNRGKWSIKDLENKRIVGIQILNGSFDKVFFKSIEIWKQILAMGLKKYIYAGNDAHGNFNYFRQIKIPMLKIDQNRRQILGQCRTGMVTKENSIKGFIESIKRGKCYITNGPMVVLKVTYDDVEYEMGSTVKIKKELLSVKINIEIKSSHEFGSIASSEFFIGNLNDNKRVDESRYQITKCEKKSLNYNTEIEVNKNIYIRASLKTKKKYNYYAFTNPIWLEF